eukprot:gb/GEZN01003208.1/.p1 GENE.gb/GEZN01003208.1/~~gb/GEZN01003208.1/.p1  ORF type:complete len:584 (+),score=34.92 gb/GEZN01003208.1/:40-1752(+)
MSETWSCAACTFLNGSSASACSICFSPKPAIGDTWACIACTYLNGPAVQSCILCNTKKPKEAKKNKVKAKKEGSESTDTKTADKENDDAAVVEEPRTIKKQISKLLMNEKFADVWFHLGRPGIDEEKELVPAHKAILSARSKVFQAFFSGPFNESYPNPVVTVPDVNPKGFKILLEFIYTDDVEIEDSSLLPAIYCAVKYQVFQLKKLCNEYSKEQCHLGNACTLLENVPFILAQDTAPLRYIEDHCYEVTESRGWLDLSPERLGLILQRDNLMIEEVELIKAVIRWATQRCEGEVTPDKLRLVLCEALPLLRFPTLQLSELANVVSPSGLLSVEQELLCYEYIVSKTPNLADMQEDDDHSHPPCPDESRLSLFSPSQYTARQGRGWNIPFDPSQLTIRQNGVFYWLGTARGRSAWTNPAIDSNTEMRDKVVCTASSAANGSPSTVTGRVSENGYTNNTENSWIQVELKSIAISPTWYQYTTRGSAGGAPLPLRNWRFEAKYRDTDDWAVLSEHSNDQTMPNTSSTTCSWRCNNPIGKNYKIFRILQTGVGHSGSHQLNFGNLELFGMVR